MTTYAYVRVSTEDQVEFSPDAQAKRCRDLARLRDLGVLTTNVVNRRSLTG
jgi:DNA invertase Pin-like site-specific DNA recombinase